MSDSSTPPTPRPRAPEPPAPGTDDYLAALAADPTAIDYDELVRTLDHLREEQRAAILDRLEGIKPEDPSYPGLHARWAQGLARQQRHAEAIDHLRLALKAAPGAAELLYRLGLSLTMESRDDEAAETLAAAVNGFSAGEQRAERAKARLALGRCHFLRGSFPDAVAMIEAALDDFAAAGVGIPEPADVYFSHGAALHAAGRTAEALGAYERGLEHRRAPELLCNYAAMQVLTGSAASALEHLLEAGPESGDLFYPVWADVLAAVGEVERTRAEERFEAQLALIADPAPHRVQWGDVLIDLRRPADALAQYERAEAATPSYDSALGAGRALERMRERDRARQRYQQAAERAGEDRDRTFRAAAGLSRVKDYERAEPLYRRLATTPAADGESAEWRGELLHVWGYALAELGRSVEALQRYHEAIRTDPDRVYSYHNLAVEQADMGAYAAAWEAWDRAVRAYENGRASAAEQENAEYFRYFGSVLHGIQGDFRNAEAALQQGLLYAPDDPLLHMALGKLYEEWKDECEDDGEADRRAILASRARGHYRAAERGLRAQVEAEEPGANRRLATLYLESRDVERAETALLEALEEEPASPELRNGLGALLAWQERYPEALKHFVEAVRLDDGLLVARTNLAECYLNLERYEKALAEYQKVLETAPGNVEMRNGLGQTYLGMGSDSEPEPFANAVEQFTAAIQLLRERRGSVRCRPRELAEVFYLRGYARVKMWEAVSRLRRDDSHLSAAAGDFRECLRLDRAHAKARTALQKIAGRATLATEQRLAEAVGPSLIALIGIALFTLTQLGFFVRGLPLPPELRETGTYALFTFASLAILIVGLTLPQLLKLKVGAIELEKSSVQHISPTSASLGIKR